VPFPVIFLRWFFVLGKRTARIVVTIELFWEGHEFTRAVSAGGNTGFSPWGLDGMTDESKFEFEPSDAALIPPPPRKH